MLKKTLTPFCLALLTLASFGQAEKIELISNGIPLNAYMYPGTGEESKPTLVWLHGNPGGMEEGKSAWSQELSNKGINVFRYNYRGLWGNGGEFNLSNSVADLGHVLDLLTSEPFVEKYGIDTGAIHVGGFSFGTAVGLIGAIEDERISKVLCVAVCDHSYFGRQVLDPHSPIRKFLEESLDALFLPDGIIPQDPDIFVDDLTDNIYRFDIVARADRLLDNRIYIFGGLDDDVCPLENNLFPFYRRLKELSHPHVRVQIAKCGHGLECEPPVTLAELLEGWVRE
jgi:pimeloyl-ACP methyl ester carboxylesterase